MTDERLAELRAIADDENFCHVPRPWLGEAADEIDSLRDQLAESDKLRERAEFGSRPSMDVAGLRQAMLDLPLGLNANEFDADSYKHGHNDALKAAAALVATCERVPVAWHLVSDKGSCGMDSISRTKPVFGTPSWTKDVTCYPLYEGEPITPPAPLPSPVFRDEHTTEYRENGRNASVALVGVTWGWRCGASEVWTLRDDNKEVMTREQAESAAAAYVGDAK